MTDDERLLRRMKNATKHAEELRTLFKRLLKDQKPEPRVPAEPLKALVRGALSFDAPDARAEEAMQVIAREFCDFNELRVATELEIQEMLGPKYPGIERRVALMTQALNAIFEKEHTLSLDRLKPLPKKEARQFVRDLPDMHSYVEAYVMLYGFESPAVPVDEMMLALLKEHGVVEQQTTAEEAQKFLEGHVKAEEAYDLFASLRRAALAEESKTAKKKKG